MRNRIGRYRYTYGTSVFDSPPTCGKQDKTLSLGQHHVDIARADFQKVQVRCWPIPENRPDARRRRWGKIDETNAAIMHFEMRASQSLGYKIKKFELSLLFRPVSENAPTSGPDSSRMSSDEGSPGIYLFSNPAPSNTPELFSNSKENPKPWLFWGESVPGEDDDGHSREGKWTWESKGHDLRLLHAAIVIQHPNEPFLMQCKVKGEAFRMLGWKFTFNSEGEVTNWWRIEPRAAECESSGFKQCVADLDLEVTRRNLGQPSCEYRMRINREHLELGALKLTKTTATPNSGSNLAMNLSGHYTADSQFTGNYLTANTINVNSVDPKSNSHTQSQAMPV